MNNAPLKEHLSQIFINSADLVEYKQANDSTSKTLFIRIPYRSLPAFRKVSEKVVEHLESKFSWPVIVVATRTIISKWGKYSYLYTSLGSYEIDPSSLSHELLNITKPCLLLCSQETQNSKETKKQNSYRCPRCCFGRRRKIYYKLQAGGLINIK